MEPSRETFTLSVTSAEVCDFVRICVCACFTAALAQAAHIQAVLWMAVILFLLKSWGVFFKASASSLPCVLHAGAAAMKTRCRGL